MASVSSETYLLHMLYRADRAVRDLNRKKPMVAELKALEFWRAIIAECLGSFMYVFLVCGSHVLWPLHSVNHLTRSLTNGFAMATAAHCFGPMSGAHLNPALSFAMLAVGRITPLRALLYVTAQCGGAIAGAALLYGVTTPRSSPQRVEVSLGCTLVSESLSPWQAAALESVLTFVVAFALFASNDPNRKGSGDALALGIAYLACTLIALPATGASMNPARSLGPAFVTNTWKHHWVYWSGPVIGGLVAGLIYEYIFESPRKISDTKETKMEDSEKDSSELRDETDSKISTTRSAPGPSFRVPPPEGPKLHPKGPYPRYSQQVQAATSYYSTLPGRSASSAGYRTWSSEYGAQTPPQFKF